MQFFGLPLLIAFCGVVYTADANPCTNGSFEQLGPNGFPVDWAPVGSTVEVSSDARSGRYSLRLLRARRGLRTADTSTRETGLNRTFRTADGCGVALIDRLRGGIDFWYKAVSATSAELNVYAIPVGDDRIEKTGSPRAVLTVPDGHIGDGRWHHGRLKYDFSDNPNVKWVHFAARIVGTAGELLLDDFSYVERVGTILRVDSIRLEEDPDQPGRRCTVRAEVENAGDALASSLRAAIAVPEGFRTVPAEIPLGDLAPDAKRRAVWAVEGRRGKSGRWTLTAISGGTEAMAALPLAPALAIRSFGPVSPVAMEGQPIAVECVLENTGNVIVAEPVVEFELPSGKMSRGVEELAPGRSVTLRATFTPSDQSPALPIAARAWAGNVDGELTARSILVVGASTELPPPAGVLVAGATDQFAELANEHLRLAFRPGAFGFGPGEIAVATGSGWHTIAWLARLSRVVYLTADGTRQEETVFAADPPETQIGPTTAGLRFDWTTRDVDRATWRVAVKFTLAADEKTISADYEIACDRPWKLLAFEGPMLYALRRDEAILPGLEWLVDDEVSSSTLDIAEGHPHQVRYVVHPNMVTIPAIGIHSAYGTVGLLWDVHQKWDGTRDRPSVVFASPDRFENQRAHLVGLFLPTVPEYVEPNTREASRPYPMKPGRPLRLRASIYADATATGPLAAPDEWFRQHGFPAPKPLPHRSYEREIEFSMRAYLESLWVPEIQQWWTTKGNQVLSRTGRPRMFVADLLLGEILGSDPELRRRCRARAEEVLAPIGGEPRVDAQRHPGRADLAFANPARAAALLSSRDEIGAWRFDADHQPQSGPFVGRDYRELGPDEAVEIGTCARRAFEVLRYARIAGDWEAYDKMQTTLELMETFRVPAAAQVWEVPVHTPDVLAAADAVDAFVEAYRFSGRRRWLDDAVTWARRGLPFIYCWDDPEKPFLLGASIPVFGATWHRGSWFGRPVQWNGLRYANALLKLSEYDQSYPWRQIAETVIRSAIHQQDLDGENVALWPDNISAIDSTKCPWVFAPRQIIRNVLKLIGRDEDPATVILGEGRKRLHVTTTAKVTDARWDGSVLSFHATYPRGEQGVVLVANTSRPTAVRLDGRLLRERAGIEDGEKPGWRYDAANAYLAVRVIRDGDSLVRIEGAEFRKVRRDGLVGRAARL